MSESKENDQNRTQRAQAGLRAVAPEQDLARGEKRETTDDFDPEDAPRKPRLRAKDAPPPDEQSARVLQFISDVVSQMQMQCEVELEAPGEGEDRDIRLEISGEDAGRIIGKKGQVLGALQFLANRVLNRPGEERRYVTVDAEGYRSRRDNSLAAMAKRLGKQAMTDGKIITFEPMPPRDRRVVHLALAKLDGVVTKSEGDGDSRRVQIIPVRR
jgi:spoIIIJ-associated protein